jgi:hypothetical protein
MSEPERGEEHQRAPWLRASLNDVAAVDFELPIAGLKTADCGSIYDKYREVADKGNNAQGELVTPEARVFNMLWAITSMHFKPNEPNEPFGPMMSFADGRRSAVPTDFRGEPLEVVAWMAERATNLVLRARLCDMCWLLDRKRAALAVQAISSYVEVVRLVDQKLLTFQFQEDDQDQAISHSARDILRRALQIARKTGLDKQEAVAAKQMVATLRKRALSSGALLSTLWFSTLDLDFSVSNPSDVADDIEHVLKDGKKADASLHNKAELWNCAARAYNIAKREDD